MLFYQHCAKSVQIRRYFWSVFPRIRTEEILNKKIHFLSSTRLGPAITRGNTVSFELAEKNISEQNFSNQRN